MARKPSGGDLVENVAFDMRVTGNPDSPADYGNTVLDFVEQFRRRAGYIHLRGGEAVIAGRLQGRHIQVVRVRSDSSTRQIMSDWRVRDVRTGIAYAVRDVSPTEDRRFLDVLCESGVAT